MTYFQLTLLHLATVLPAFVIGTTLLIKKKGDKNHRILGRIYIALMALTAVITLFMPAALGPTLANHFGFIHLFSILVLVLLPRAYIAARKHNIELHKRVMIGIYIGGIITAGSFAFMPGRLLHQWLFG